jgi:hypothetical protein
VSDLVSIIHLLRQPPGGWLAASEFSLDSVFIFMIPLIVFILKKLEKIKEMALTESKRGIKDCRLSPVRRVLPRRRPKAFKTLRGRVQRDRRIATRKSSSSQGVSAGPSRVNVYGLDRLFEPSLFFRGHHR